MFWTDLRRWFGDGAAVVLGSAKMVKRARDDGIKGPRLPESAMTRTLARGERLESPAGARCWQDQCRDTLDGCAIAG